MLNMERKRVNFVATVWEVERLRELSELTGVSMSEFLRRLIVYGGQERVIGDLFPPLSGRVALNHSLTSGGC